MSWRSFVILLLVLLLIDMAVADAKSSGRGGKSGGHSAISHASKAPNTHSSGMSTIAGLAATTGAAKITKKKVHLDDDILENDTENETAQPTPGMGWLTALLAIGILRRSSLQETMRCARMATKKICAFRQKQSA
jgi:hypothetical protein